MVEKYLSDIAELDIITQDSRDYKWIKFTPEINLNNFEKVHSWGPSDSYILRSITDPKVYMGVKHEESFNPFCQSVLMNWSQWHEHMGERWKKF